ncbi:hypothetical protein ABC347_16780 [Sphingomonas sp. 1P06PA]|uniref:hypothetical protein n=1 Tax=Sphingomonas sp. 1P06PA TaxID=554121 RepID=UPI0039A6187E
MKPFRLPRWIVAAPLAVLATCAPVPKPVAPPPAPAPAPAPPPPPPEPQDWRDLPLAAGDWVYVRDAGGTTALFGRPGADSDFLLRCDLGQRSVTLSRAGAVAAATPLTITTSSAERRFDVAPGPRAAVVLTARDPFLDRIAFSQGRIVVRLGNGARMALPAWPAMARVIEDCRG